MPISEEKALQDWKRIGDCLSNLYKVNRPGMGCVCNTVLFDPWSELPEAGKTKIIISKKSFIGSLPLLSGGDDVESVFVIQPKAATECSQELAELLEWGYELVYEEYTPEEPIRWNREISLEDQKFMVMSCLGDMFHHMNEKLWGNLKFAGEEARLDAFQCKRICDVLTGGETFGFVTEDDRRCHPAIDSHYDWLKMAGNLVHGDKVLYDFAGNDLLVSAGREFELVVETLSFWRRELARRNIVLSLVDDEELLLDTLECMSAGFGLSPVLEALRSGVPRVDLLA